MLRSSALVEKKANASQVNQLKRKKGKINRGGDKKMCRQLLRKGCRHVYLESAVVTID